LPYIPEDWTVTRFYRDVATQRNWYDCYLHKKEGFLIDKYLTCEPIKEDVKFVKKISELARALGVSDVNEFTVLKNRDKIIELIKKFPTGG
jgi:hypothetical protein